MMKNTMLEMSRYAALARQAVAEGIVLLKNEAVLPLASGGRAALFGYAQFHYYQSGTGSGGLVNTARVPNLPEVLGGPDGYQLDAEVQARYEAWLAEHPYEMGTGWAQEPWFLLECRLMKNLSALRPSVPKRRLLSSVARQGKTRTIAILPAAFC